MIDNTGRTSRATGSVSAVLFLCLFAAQAGLIAISPVLAEVAVDLGVSTATAGQLRMVSGLGAGVTALVVGRFSRRLGLRELLLAGAALLAVGSLASAVAPSFATLALAQIVVGTAVALLVTAGTTAAADWAPPEHRARVLSWALAGQAGAWIVGMPLIAAVSGASWRYAWLALPLVSAVAVGLAVFRQPTSPPYRRAEVRQLAALADATVARWALGELLAISAWAGTLVYSGALLAESYGTSVTLTGVVLALMAAAYVAGNLFFRRFLDGESRALRIRLALALAAGVMILGAVRPTLVVSAIVLAVCGFLAGGRTLAGSAFGLDASPERRLAMMGARSAANQFGYFVGSAAAGAALAVSGYEALGLVLGALLVAAAVSQLVRFPVGHAQPAVATASISTLNPDGS